MNDKTLILLQIGKAKSTGVPGKNLMKINSKYIMEYPLIAASNIKRISHRFISTDSIEIAEIASKYGSIHIDRPKSLCQKETLTEDVLIHALKHIREEHDIYPDLILIVFCNVLNVVKAEIEKAIEILDNDHNNSYDSVFSVSEFNMFSPMRSRKIKNNLIQPYVDLSNFENISSLRDSQDACYFANFGVQLIRSSVIENIHNGMPPVKWMGNKSFPIISDFGFDIDADWQIPALEYWTKKNL